MIYKNITQLLFLTIFCSGCSFTDKNVEKNNDSIKRLSHHVDSETKNAVVSYGLASPESEDVVDTAANSDDKPTEFKVKDYIADNTNCKIVYTSSPDGNKEGSEVRTGTFEAYVHDGVLFRVECSGADSNIDYKLNMKSDNGQKYRVVGSYSYFKETAK